MRKLTAIISAIAFVVVLFGATAFAEETAVLEELEQKVYCSATVEDNFEPGVVLVVLKKSATVINMERTVDEFPGIAIESIEDISTIDNDEAMTWVDTSNYHQILKMTLVEKTKDAVIAAIAVLEQNEKVWGANPNYYVALPESFPAGENAVMPLSLYPNDTVVSTNTYPYSTIKLPQAWAITTGSASVKVGVMGAGINSQHPDLQGNLETSLGINATSDDISAWVEAGDYALGTEMAGVLGAVGNNTIGISGTCWSLKMVSLKVLKQTYTGDEDGIVAINTGIQYATNQRIPILCLGVTYETGDISLRAAIMNYPGLVVVGAGDWWLNVDEEYSEVYPCVYPEENLIVVAATTNTDQLAAFSNYGATSVDLAAPGDDIQTTQSGSYSIMSGTHLSAAFVAGTAALIKSIRPDLTSREIKDIILSSVDEIPALEGKVATGGRLNVYAALQMAQDYAKRGELLAGDFDGDGTDEVAAFFQEKEDGENSAMKLRVWESTDTRYDSLSGEQWGSVTLYDYDAIEGRIAVGDFDGDGDDDIATLCDRGLQTNGTYSSWLVVWHSYSDRRRCMAVTRDMMTDFNADKMTDRVAAGDFNGDGYDDMAAIYDYGVQADTGHCLMKGWVWEGSAGNAYTRSVKFQSDWFDSTNLTGRVTAGDYNGDGYDDVAAFYDYGVQADTGHSLMKLFTWNGAASGNYAEGVRCQSDWFDASQMTDRVVSGDFNDDGYDDIVGFFSYGNQTSNLFYFRGVANGSTMPHGVGYTGSDIHAVNMTNAVVAGDFDGDGDEEIYTLYTDASGAVLWEFYVGTSPTFVRVEKWRQY